MKRKIIRPDSKSSKTPLMNQYWEIKLKYPNEILFFRCGDFYEIFYDDAKIASEILDLVITERHGVPMSGMPFHAIKNYLSPLLKAGYSIAICEQMETAGEAKGVIKREVTEVLSPGILFDDEQIDGRSHNYTAFIGKENQSEREIVFVDPSLGEWRSAIVTEDRILFWLEFMKPSELIFEIESDRDLYAHSNYIKECPFGFLKADKKQIERAPDFIKNGSALAKLAWDHIISLQPLINAEIQYLLKLEDSSRLQLDVLASKHLEIFPDRGQRTKTDLFSAINRCLSPNGARLLIDNLRRPLIYKEDIYKRQNSIEELLCRKDLHKNLGEALILKFDGERLCHKFSVLKAGPKNLLQLKALLGATERTKKIISQFKDPQLICLAQELKDHSQVLGLIDSAINDNPPSSFKEGQVIKSGFDRELDELRKIEDCSSQLLIELEQKYKAKYEIASLKIKYNRMFGYLIEISNSHKDKVPEEFIRRQTLRNSERYSSNELSELETKILESKELALNRELFLYHEIQNRVLKEIPEVLNSCKSLSYIDFLFSLARLAIERNYNRPVLSNNKQFEVTGLRHPVVEYFTKEGKYIPCNFKFTKNQNLAIITGPNMAGKSTFIRASAILFILAQIGSWVPASSANIGICDGIYTRIGASDKLALGQSTFMVEMSETSQILKKATNKSLVILDELGRGTSTYDGIAIASSVSKFLSQDKTPRTLFATHYHELSELSDDSNGRITNYTVEVSENKNGIEFLYSLKPGMASKSFGIEVAKLAGLPDSVLEQANYKLKELENTSELNTKNQIENKSKIKEAVKDKAELSDNRLSKLAIEHKEFLAGLDLNQLTPIETWNILNQLKESIKEVTED